MNKLFYIFLLLLFPLSALGQTSLEDADALYADGNYTAARKIYVKYKNNAEVKIKYKNCQELKAMYDLALEAFNKGLIKTAEKYCDVILDRNPSDPNAIQLKKNVAEEIKKKQEIREKEFEEARSQCSLEKLQEFKKKYSKQAEQVARADALIEDISMWNKAKSLNTRDAYSSYLSQTKTQFFADEAKSLIGQIDSETQWAKIKGSRNLLSYSNYLSNYKQYSRHIEEAEASINLLTAVNKYSDGNLGEAYFLFSTAKQSSLVTFTYRDEEMYQECLHYYKYSQLDNNASESQLMAYLRDYPNSKYCNEVSSRIAVIKAGKLNYSSSSVEKEQAMSYAKTEYSKQYVQGELNRCRKEKRQFNRRTYGPTLTVGLGIDAGFADGLFELGGGLNLRIGRFNHFANLTIGVGYKVFTDYADKRNNSEKESKEFSFEDFTLYSGRLYIPVNLKLNLIKLGDGCRLYIGGGAEYSIGLNKAKIELIDNTDLMKNGIFSYYPQIGLNSRHIDFSIYYKMYQNMYNHVYKTYITDKIWKSNNYIGGKFICYF